MRRQFDGRGDRRATALQDLYGKPIPHRLEREPKARRRRLACRRGRPEQDHKGTARLGRNRQPAQLLVPGVAKPREQRMAGPCAQHLLRRPQRIAPARRAHHRQMREIDARGSEGRGIRQVRRREPYDALSRPGQGSQRRQHELQLTDPFLQAEQLGKRARRPATARQFPVKGRITRGNRSGTRRKRCPAPDRVLLENLFERKHGLYLYTVFADHATLHSDSAAAAYPG
jgi:hypothetical protein